MEPDLCATCVETCHGSGWVFRAARLQAERTVPRDSRRALRNGSFKVRRWPEGDRTAGAMASIAPGAASPYPTGIPHPSEPPTSSQPERWRLPWRRRQCQPSTGIRGFGEVRDGITLKCVHPRTESSVKADRPRDCKRLITRTLTFKDV